MARKSSKENSTSAGPTIGGNKINHNLLNNLVYPPGTAGDPDDAGVIISSNARQRMQQQ